MKAGYEEKYRIATGHVREQKPHRTSRRLRHKKLAAVSLFILAALLGFVESAPAEQVLQGHLPAAAARAQTMGRLPAATSLKLALGLPLRNRQALTNLLEQLYDPASQRYRQFLTAEQFAAEFGPTEQDYAAVMDWARSEGLRIVATHPNRVLLDLEASVGEIERAFHLEMHVYQHPREQRTFYAPTTDPRLDLTVPILSISGLDNFIRPHPANLQIAPAARPLGPEPAAGSGPNGSYMGKDFRAAYAPSVALTGAGQYVGLLQFDGYYPSDIAAYVNQAGISSVPLVNILLNGFSGNPGANNVEVALDIEMAISMAPGLNAVLVYEGQIGNDILNRMATDNLAKQLSASWTFPGDATTPQIFQQYAVQGQSYFNAAGDSGAYTGSIPHPADSPYVTSVGGTTLSTRGPVLGWLSETTWNWRSTGQGTGASSGGMSPTWPIPSWQQGINMATNLGSTTLRNIPDVSMVADNVLVRANNGGTTFAGGDSISAPLWAAFIALANQQAAQASQPTVGFINPAIYALGQTTNYTNAFHDIKTGNNTNLISPTRFYAVTGYDLCTGWGSPAGKSLINALAPPVNARVVISAGTALLLESCSAPNSALDPGEAVVVNFSLQNVGGVNATNLVATLLTNSGVVPLSGPQTYGSLVGGGPTVTRSFTFIANGTCGATASPTLQLQDGPTNLGNVVFTLPLGVPQTIFTQYFDSVVAPALPAGWTTALSGGASNWITSSSVRDSTPNSARAIEATNAGVAELLSPSIAITSAAAQLTFKNNYNTEVDPAIPSKAFDGGVLEIKIGAGAFTDILSAGGSFVTGGYTRTIDTAGENPLDGRQVWAGVTSGFITSTVNLPAAAAGQNIQLKWRFGMDNGNYYGGLGWYIDSIAVKEGSACCTPASSNDLVMAQTIFPNPGAVGQPVTYLLSTTNLGPAPATSLSIMDTLPSTVTLTYASPGCTNLGGIIVCSTPLLLSGAATNFTLLLTPTNAGPITNVATVSSGTADFNPTNNTLTHVLPVYQPPVISLQPTSQVALIGANASFNVAASGTEPLSYQWTFGGTNLPGETATTLQLTNIQAEQAGTYRVVVTNLAGSVMSDPANLKVLVPPTIQLASVAVTPTNFSLSLNSVSGLNYLLEYKDSLSDSNWTALPPPVAGTGGIIVLQDNTGPLPSRFYRVNCN